MDETVKCPECNQFIKHKLGCSRPIICNRPCAARFCTNDDCNCICHGPLRNITT